MTVPGSDGLLSASSLTISNETELFKTSKRCTFPPIEPCPITALSNPNDANPLKLPFATKVNCAITSP